MKRLYVLMGLFLSMSFVLPKVMQAQCPNLDFTLANFNYWQAYIGSCAGGVSIYPSSAIPGRHTIMDASNLLLANNMQDENCIIIPKVPNGFNYSARLGNSNTGAEMEALEYTMRIDSTNSLLIVRFAWAMQDPSHEPSAQPKFTMTIKDSIGRIITDILCGNVDFVASQDLEGLACKTNSFIARDWTTVGFSLEPFMGRMIKIYFETRDCTQSEHYGYAYIVGECRPMAIDQMYCNGQAAARLRAPHGFSSYKWTRNKQPSWKIEGSGSSFQNIVIYDPVEGEEIICEVTSELGPSCSAILHSVIAKTVIDADFLYGVMENGGVDLLDHNNTSWYDTCSRTATFVDLSTVKNSKKESILWEIRGLNVASQDSLFTYTFPDPATNEPVEYLVRLTVYSENGCVDTSVGSSEHRITIYPSSRVEIVGEDQMCEGDSTPLTAVAVRSTFVNHEWTWEDSNKVKHTATGDTLMIHSPGTYFLTSLDSAGCYARDSLIVTNLRPEMTVTITDVKCYGEATGLFTHGPITGGNPPYQIFQWKLLDTNGNYYVDINGNATGNTYLNLIAGKYIFEAVDSRSCPLYGEVIIKQNDSLKIQAIAYPATSGFDNGRLKLTATGGIPPYQFEIRKDDGTLLSSSDTIAGLSVGDYLIEVADYEQCVTSATISVTVRGNSQDTLLQSPICETGDYTIPNSVKIIGDRAFEGCTGLTSVTIGTSVTTIGTSAFFGCSGLTAIYVKAQTPPSVGNNAFSGVSNTIPVHVPCGSEIIYQSDSVWSNFSNIIGDISPNISVQSNDNTMGSVSITQANTCANNGTAIIEATAYSDYRFVQWNDGNTQNPRTITVTQDTAFTAEFSFSVAPTSFYVFVTANNTNRGSVFGSGDYTKDSTITIGAIANSGYRFVQWNDGIKQNPRSITVTQDSIFTAEFAVATPGMFYVSLTVNSAAMGSVSGSGDYAANSMATIGAIANQGYRFVQWNDGNTDNPRSITVTGDSIFMAIFESNVGITDATVSTISVYPNPATDNIHIILPENIPHAVFTLYDMQGKVLIHQEVNSQKTVSVSKFASGIYIYHVRTEKENCQGKIIKR